MIMMGKSIRQIWVNLRVHIIVALGDIIFFIHLFFLIYYHDERIMYDRISILDLNCHDKPPAVR